MIKFILSAVMYAVILWVMILSSLTVLGQPGMFTALLVIFGIAFVLILLWHILRPHFGAIARWLQL